MAKSEKILKGVEWVDDNIDIGLYEEARKENKTFSMKLEEFKNEKEESPYVGMTKRQVIQEKQKYRNSGQVAPLTAFEQLLCKAGMNIHNESDKLSKFFEYSDTPLLFPELISDRVYAGELQSSLVPQLTFAQTTIEEDTFKKLYLADTQDDRDLKEISKLEDLPETKIVTSDNLIRLNMYGRYLSMSKYDMNKMSIAAFNRFMERIGLQIGIRKTDLLIYRLFNGDGNTGSTPGTTVTSAASGAGAINFADTISWAAGLPAPYKMDVSVFRKAGWVAWITRLYDGTTTSIGNDKFNAFPMALEWDRSNAITANYAIGVDSRYAVEEVSTGAPLVESEKLVRRVGEGTAISTMFEYPIADNDAVATFNFTS